MKLHVEFLSRFLALAAVMLLSFSCEVGKVNTTEDETVSWPELVAFDELAYRAEGLAKIKDRDGILGQRPALLEAGSAVSPESVPNNVKNPEQVRQLLGDLSSLIDGIAKSDISDATLFSLVEGLHPVVASLIKAAGMPHLHTNEGPNDGSLHPVFGGDGEQVGTAEIKLHDDAGDIEVWLTSGGHGGPPWDLPTDSVLILTFPDLGKQIDLAVRDSTENRDEEGNGTVRDGATNYFVFPGETGADASWLMGREFAAKAILDLEAASTGDIILRPHVHHEEEES
ncbi:MAG: hypothetical protein AAGC68_01450 [Verrucomicrobiota bacterium]